MTPEFDPARPPDTWPGVLDGELLASRDARLPLHNEAFLLGRAVFTTLRWRDGHAEFGAAHVERLKRHAVAGGLADGPRDLPTTEVLAGDLALLAPRLAGRDAALRWTLFPSLHEPSRECGANADHGGPSTGTAPAVSRWLSVRPLPAGASEGIHLVRATACFERHPSEALKHTGRLAKVLERERARALGAHDAYGVSRAGEVLSGTAGCLFWAVGEEVYTPPPSGGLLDSVVRAALVADGCARPRRLDASDLDVPSEVLWANSLHGVLAVRSLEGRPSPLLGPSGPAFRRLSQRFEALAARSRVPLAGE